MSSIESELTACPVCGELDAVDTVERKRLPAMQNYVYRDAQSSRAAPRGRLLLAVCRICGFAWNRTFDASLLVYDEGYDNAVPSEVMQAYYTEIAGFLNESYALDNGVVVDVGCGDGGFLRSLCASVPGSRGLGIDPALAHDRVEEEGRVRLVKALFSVGAVTEPPSLVVSRHVLEHMPKPVSFLQAIGAALAEFGPRPCFFEVPDVHWIIDHDAFWDFCYEHCNYFTKESFAEALRRAGFEPMGARSAFGSQYLWIEATSNAGGSPRVGERVGLELAERMRRYAAAENERIDSMRTRLSELKRDGSAIAVWGMATKGVLFSILVDPDGSLIDFCVDVNANKQGCFVPLTGHLISAPTVLREHARNRPLTVVVMNENYRDEIERACRAMGVKASFARLADAESRTGQTPVAARAT